MLDADAATAADTSTGGVRVRRKRSAIAAALTVGVLLAGCGGTSSVRDNQQETCATLAGFESWITPTLVLTNPEGTVGDAQAGLATGRTATQEARASFSSSQQELLDRFERTVGEYEFAAKARDPNARLADSTNALDSFQMNLMSNYRIMLQAVGCPLPGFYAAVPTG